MRAAWPPSAIAQGPGSPFSSCFAEEFPPGSSSDRRGGTNALRKKPPPRGTSLGPQRHAVYRKLALPWQEVGTGAPSTAPNHPGFADQAASSGAIGESLFKLESYATSWLSVASKQPSWWAQPEAFSSPIFLSKQLRPTCHRYCHRLKGVPCSSSHTNTLRNSAGSTSESSSSVCLAQSPGIPAFPGSQARVCWADTFPVRTLHFCKTRRRAAIQRRDVSTGGVC